MIFGASNRGVLWFCAGLGFVVSGLALHAWLGFEGIPPRAVLQAAQGRVAWVEGRRDLRFGLQGEPGAFAYPSINGAVGAAGTALRSARRPEVTVLFDPRQGGVAGDGRRDVFELAVDGKTVVSHAQVAASRTTNARIAGALALVMAACSIYLLMKVRRLRRRRGPPRFLRLPETRGRQ